MLHSHRNRWLGWFSKLPHKTRATRRLSFDSLEERRLLTAGSLDPTFGTGGVATIAVPGNGLSREVIQPDGKILAVLYGTSSLTGVSDELMRLNADGSLDSSFGSGGIVPVAIRNPAFSVALQADGKILLVGDQRTANESDMQLTITRYNADGTIDSTFGNQGQAFLPVNTDAAGSGTSVAVQADGEIVVATTAFGSGVPNGSSQVLVQLKSDGSLDTSFNGTGLVYFGPGAENRIQGGSVQIQSDGKIDVAWDGLWQFNADGSAVTSFGNDGSVPLANSFSEDLVIQPDGKLIVASGDYLTMQPFELRRFNTDGTVDTTFNGGTPVVDSFGISLFGNTFFGNGGLALGTAGQIIVTGQYVDSALQPDLGYGIVQYNSDGMLDYTFGNSGLVSVNTGSSLDDVAVDSAGNIVAVGGSNSNVEVYRYDDSLPSTTPSALNLQAAGNDKLFVNILNADDFLVSLDGATTIFSTSQYNQISFTGSGGTVAVVSGALGSANSALSPDAAAVSGGGLTINIANTDTIYIYGDNSETASLSGGTSGNVLSVAPGYSSMFGPGFVEFAVGFGQTYGYSSGSQDTAYFYAGSGNTFVGTPTYSYLSAGGTFSAADGFSSILALAAADGSGQAWLYGSTGTNSFVANSQYSYMSGAGFFNEVTGFQSVMGVSGSANDYAYLSDTAGNASFSGYATYSFLASANFTFQAIGFANIIATGTPADQAAVYDSDSNDVIQQNGAQVVLQKDNGGGTLLNSFGEVEGHVATADDPNHEVDYFYNGLGS